MELVTSYIQEFEKELRADFVMIPMYVLCNERLKANEQIMFGLINSLSTRTGFCWAANKYFAKVLKCRPESVSRRIKKLETEKLICIKYIKTTRYIYPGACTPPGFDVKINKHHKKSLTHQ